VCPADCFTFYYARTAALHFVIFVWFDKMCGKVDPLWHVEMTPEAVTWYCLLHGLNTAIGKRRFIMAVLLQQQPT